MCVVCICMFVSVHMCMCMCARVYAHVYLCVKTRGWCGMFFSITLYLILDPGSLTDPGTHQFSRMRWPVIYRDPPAYTSPALRLQVRNTTLSFLCGHWESELSFSCLRSKYFTNGAICFIFVYVIWGKVMWCGIPLSMLWICFITIGY